MISRLASVQRRFLEEESILDITRDHEKTLSWLVRHNLLKADRRCEQCGYQNMKIERDNSKADLKRFRCGACRKTTSIRMGSFFQDSKLTLMEYTRIIFYYFLNCYSRTEVVEEMGINKNTVTDIYSSLRFHVSRYFKQKEEEYKLGDVIEDIEDNELGVEIDESLFSHINGDQVWVFGIYDRKTSDARVFVVENRSAEVLIPIIQANILPGARIYSDGWAAYSRLSELGFDHRVVIHEEGFGRGFFTTNHVESLWSQLKFLTKQSLGCVKGIGEDKKEGIQNHLDVGIWRRKHKGDNLVEELCRILNSLHS